MNQRCWPSTKPANGVNDDNDQSENQRCSPRYTFTAVRFALSLGMLLGMSHGWVTAEGQANNNSGLLEVVRTVKSTTSFSPFSSGQHQFFPY
jgi:hypothetical protein